MGVSEHEKLSIDDFFEAIAGLDGRYELVGGVAYAMPGARQRHNVIRSNVLTAFLPTAKRKGSRATSVNTGVQTGRIRSDIRMLWWIAARPMRRP